MARAEVIHSEDAVCVMFRGNPKRPEPSCAVIKFPGGHVEVSRASDGTYWAHVEVVDPANVAASRIDYIAERASLGIPALPGGDHIKHIAVRIANRVPHFDPDSAA